MTGFSGDPKAWYHLRAIQAAAERQADIQQQILNQLTYQSKAMHELYQLLEGEFNARREETG